MLWDIHSWKSEEVPRVNSAPVGHCPQDQTPSPENSGEAGGEEQQSTLKSHLACACLCPSMVNSAIFHGVLVLGVQYQLEVGR